MSSSSQPPPHKKAELFKIALSDLLRASKLKTSLDVLTLVDLIVDYGPNLVEMEDRYQVLSAVQTEASSSFLSAWSTSTAALRLTTLWLDAAFNPNSAEHQPTQEIVIRFLGLLPTSYALSRDRKLRALLETAATSQSSPDIALAACTIIEKWGDGTAATQLPSMQKWEKKRKYIPTDGLPERATKEHIVMEDSSVEAMDIEEPPVQPPMSLEDICKYLRPQDIVEHIEAAVSLVRTEQFQWSDNQYSGMFILLALLLKVIGTKELYRHLLSLQGDEAQSMLNAIQLLLDFPASIDLMDRRSLLKALLRLSSKSELYPKCLTLQQVERSSLALDEGSYGEVYRGRFRNQDVALKVFKVRERSDISKILKAVWKEAIIWSQFNHDNLLPFYGVYHLDDQYNRVCLVSPWMEMGNVVDYLKLYPRADRLLLLSDIAKGIAYLHENEVIHGDLKGANILVTTLGRACLADFGLSKVSDPSIMRWTSVNTATTQGGTLRWQAPEIFTPEDVGEVVMSTKSDIYSFACVCYEILTGRIPFYQIAQPYVVLMKVMTGIRPTKPPNSDPAFQEYGLTESIWELMEICWSQEPDARPTALDILESPALSTLVDGRQERQWEEFSGSKFRRAMTMLSEEC